MKICCVYMIVNLVNGNHYVGSTIDFIERKRIHIYDLETGQHHSKYLQRSWDKHGSDSFKFVVIAEATNRSCRFIEAYYLSVLRCQYNSDQVDLNCRFTVSDSTRKKMSEIAKADRRGQRMTAARLEKWKVTGNPRKGKPGAKLSDLTKEKISQSRRGSRLTDEHREKLRLAALKRYKNPEERKKMKQYADKRWGNCAS